MAPFHNWQNQAKADGWRCLVDTRQLSGSIVAGRIGKTQVTQPGVDRPRPMFAKHEFKRKPTDYLLRLSMLKRSMAGSVLVPADPKMFGRPLTGHEHSQVQRQFRSKFFSKLKACAYRESGLLGADIVLGANHYHFSVADQSDEQERNGNYKKLPPIPARFVVDEHGHVVAWAPGLLSDSRSIGDWVLELKRTYVRGEMESEDGPVPDDVAIHRVGRFAFYT